MSNRKYSELAASLTTTIAQGEQKSHLCFLQKEVDKTVQVYNQKGKPEKALLEFDENDRLIGLRLSDDASDTAPASTTKNSYVVALTKEDMGRGSVGYIQVTPCTDGVARTIIAADENKNELGINLDIDVDGHVLGIELMNGDWLPVDTEPVSG